MARRFLLAALVLPLCMLLFVGHASAQITPSLLADALLSRSELNSVLSAINIDASFNRATDLDPQTGDRIGTCRVYGSNNGYSAAICLYVNADGSRPDTDLNNIILSGQALQNVALNTGIIESIDNFALLGSTGLADNDQLATFTAVSSGVNLDIVADVFTQGNIAGYVFFASSTTADAGTAGGILGAQIGKLTQ